MPDLKEALQSLADRQATESTGDFDAVVATASSRRRRRTGSWVAVAAAAVAVGVVATVAPRHTAVPQPAVRPQDPIVVTPETAKPGQIVALTFPRSSPRGVAFQLAKESESSTVLYYLSSDWGQPPAGHRPTWAKPADGFGWPDVGINGPGPDRVVVPETIADGRYRLCTANARPQVCGLLTVAR
ncbi:hypothetical protein AB0E69_00805 [Kribbella sp. NPDC026611]|uniref:hypothetical protein n=1 Tax=Kribbella sp. NPDC026611 TaxID=3154911 RepID=UPI0033D46930